MDSSWLQAPGSSGTLGEAKKKMAANYIPTVDEAEQIAKEANRQIREVLGNDTGRATVTPGVVRVILSVASEILGKPKEA